MTHAPAIAANLEELRTWIVTYVAERLGVDRAAVDPRAPFRRLGLDSQQSTELVSWLGKRLGRALSPVLAWRCPTPESLAQHLLDPTASDWRDGSMRDEDGRGGEDGPIAIVGMSCRVPGGPDVEVFWRLLRGGVDAITEVPAGRWDAGAWFDPDPRAPGKANSRWGGFLDRIDAFDAAFFGISPREAASMDPQQRLLLELSWEALEDAGVVPGSLKGSPTGVFFGSMWDDYATLVHRAAAEAITSHTSTGHHRSILANRVSYALGLHGPSMSIDSACSSSLVAVHLACESLRRGESSLALAGGVNLDIVPESALGMSQLGGLSPDGRCFTFDARANGYVRGEGGGVVLLKTLARARADGDRVLAVIRGSAVNNDGATNGLTAPNPAAQEAVLRSAYARAGVSSEAVQYVEAHGTGTALGDPIEAGALGAVLGRGRSREHPLLIGSVKTNIGHLEGAAGIVGLIKVVLCILHRKIPASLNFEVPNPHIPFSDWNLRVQRALGPWPREDRPLVAGVSSFGMGGTNAHVVLAEPDRERGVVFVFGGQGAQWAGMGLGLLEREPVFRETLVRCDAAIRRHLGWSLLDALRAEDARLDGVAVGFPAIVAVEIALADLWRARGVEPAAVVGHSIGEIAAAHVAGALDFDDAMRIVCAYARVLGDRVASGGAGAMGVVGLSWQAACEAVSDEPGRLFPAIEHGADLTVLAGDTGALDRVLERLEGEGVFCRRVATDAAAHCPWLNGLRADLRAALLDVRAHAAAIPIFSEVTGGALDGASFDGDHWVRNLCDRALFSTAIDGALEGGFELFLELSPHPVALGAIESNLRRRGGRGMVVHALRRGASEVETMQAADEHLRARYAHRVHGDRPGRRDRRVLRARDVRAVLPFPLSGKTEAALFAQAGRLRAHLEEHPDASLADVAHSLGTARTHFERRAVIVARERAELLDALGALEAGELGPGVTAGEVSVEGKVVFVFPGQGTQWPGMARGLLGASPVFREQIEACERALAPHVGWSLRAVLEEAEGAPSLAHTHVVQPVLFAMMVALAAVWRSLGVEPDAVVGHSQGEIAAACVAGVLSLEDAARIVALRSRALAELAGRGAMMAVELPAHELSAYVGRFGGALAVAAINSPRSATVSGDARALDALLGDLARDGVFALKLPGDLASHGDQVEVLRSPLLEAFSGIVPREGTVPFYSTVTGQRTPGAALDAAYWYENLRRTVRFGDAARAAMEDGHRFFIEISPHPVLMLPLQETIEATEVPAVAVGSLWHDEGDMARMLASLAELHVHGRELDWKTVVPEGRRAPLPSYAFRRERHWLDAFAAPAPGSRSRQGDEATIDACRYRIVWRPLERDPRPRPRPGGAWWLVLPDACSDEEARALALHLGHAGARITTIRVPDEDPGDGAERALLVAHLREARARCGSAPDGVLSLLGFDERPMPAYPAVPRGLARTLALVQALGDESLEAPLWVLTRGGVSVGPHDALTSPVQAMLWGLGRTAALEHPERWGGLIDVSDLEEASVSRLPAALGAHSREDQIALRHGGGFVRRLVRAPLGPSAGARAFEARGTVLITGGAGALGGHVARWLARRGAAHVVFASRRGAALPGAAEFQTELGALGVRATFADCDVADRAAVATLLARLRGDGEELRAVFHLAGIGQQRPLDRTTPSDLSQVLAAKVLGARHLDELLLDHELDAFVLFSSTGAIWGSGHQGAYAAANAFLDALAEQRHASGRSALSIAWGSWAGPGMADDGSREHLLRRGLLQMEPPRAMQGLATALGSDAPSIVVTDVDWRRFAPYFASARPRPLLEDLPEAREALGPIEGANARAADLLARLERLSDKERLRELVALVVAETAAILGHRDASRLDPKKGFVDQGLDSLMAIGLRERLHRATGIRLPATLAFDHPSPQHAAARLLDGMAAKLRPSVRAARAEAHERHVRTEGERIAIVGIGLRLPGGVVDLNGFWALLEGEIDAVSEIPSDRWDVDAFYDPDPEAQDKSYVRGGAFLDRIDLFDADFFGISPREAKDLDPQHRILLETAWQALEHAAIVPGSLEDSRTGVFVGIGPSDYERLRTSAQPGTMHALTGTHASFAAGRLAFTLGLQGPALSVDTACSSSLVALHLACQSLRHGECELALAAGVQVMASPEMFVLLSRTRALSPDGRSKTFSDRADGMGRGEGAVVLVLERESAARAAGRRILGVVRGSAVNHDGASSGITAPNGTSQQKVLRAALRDAGLEGHEVDGVECHGTGTTLGDPIEVQALGGVYGEGRGESGRLWLGAVKTNIGHLESAAGLAGVVKVVASMRAGMLPATLHTRPRNRHVEWEKLGVEVVESRRPWPRRGEGVARRAGVSAFGLSGTNAHVILEEAGAGLDVAARAHAQGGERAAGWGRVPLVLSAKSEEALRGQAERLRAYLEKDETISLLDVGYSLATTRTRFEYRAAVVAGDRAEALLGLAALAGEELEPGGRWGTGENRKGARVAKGRARGDGKLAFLFTGQGSAYSGMGRELYAAFPVYRGSLDRICACFEDALGVSLREVILEAGNATQLEQTQYGQAALFAVEVSVVRLLESWGIRADVVMGHSVGELGAAHVAGVLSLEDACRLVAARGRLMQGVSAKGAMASLQATEAEVVERLGAVRGCRLRR
ncbi:SDR family NAD(P)-dependent oxidoreductase [Pendulispora albinea]|uniref:SDR family NAD(P)-dependent oxidoreductase n=1 Tax=Pendulispora albinea TaxID=2741071 RepID=UPI00374E00FE